MWTFTSCMLILTQVLSTYLCLWLSALTMKEPRALLPLRPWPSLYLKHVEAAAYQCASITGAGSVSWQSPLLQLYTSETASKEATVSITDSSLEYGAFWGLNEFLVNVMWPSKQTRFLRKLSGRRSKLKSERKSSQRKKIKKRKEKFDSLENGKKRGEAHYFYTVFELFIKLH